MAVVKVTAKVVTDNTGVSYTLPVLITEQGVIEPLLDYLLKHFHDRSRSWMERVVQATLLLMHYLEANSDCFEETYLLFQNFAQHLYSGTIGDDGLDPSGLYWLPRSTRSANVLIGALTGLTDWLAETQRVKHMNPLSPTDSYTQRLNYAAWHRRNTNNFLGHIKDNAISSTARLARNLRGRRSIIAVDDDTIAFPEQHFQALFLDGFGKQRDRRCALRDQLILLMMHGAGVRESEPMHLYVEDVFDDLHELGSAIVRLYHPQDGVAPNSWKDRNGLRNRSAYLKAHFGLIPALLHKSGLAPVR